MRNYMDARTHELKFIGLTAIPEINPGDDLAKIIDRCARAEGVGILEGDIFVIAQKIVSKSEDRIINLRSVTPSMFAINIANVLRKDPRLIEVILSESKAIIKMQRGVLIVETHSGLICANAGVDWSNVPGEETVALLPANPDKAALNIRREIKTYAGANVAVVISDTFGRPWREGLVNVAIGISGLNPVHDYRDLKDHYGKPLRATVLAVGDELASAAELVMGKMSQIPVVVVRGYKYEMDESADSKMLLRNPADDLFR